MHDAVYPRLNIDSPYNAMHSPINSHTQYIATYILIARMHILIGCTLILLSLCLTMHVILVFCFASYIDLFDNKFKVIVL